MKGFIFTNFIDFVEKHHGLKMVDEMILTSNLPSEGIYSAFSSYNYSELVTLLIFLSQKTDTKAETLLEQFGLFIFPYFIGKHSYIIKKYSNPLDFLAGIQDHIHIEVKKLYSDATLPTFSILNKTDNKLTLIYNSSKDMTYFAIGLIKGTLNHFNIKGSIIIDDSYDKNKGIKLDIQLLS
jgi:hypothetical protein